MAVHRSCPNRTVPPSTVSEGLRALRCALAGAALAALQPGAASAHGALTPGEESNLAGLAEAANLVVLADVVDVRYRNIPIKGEQSSIPNTFVKLAIKSTYRGAAQGVLELRFLGGADGRGGIMGLNGVPMFNVGETGVFFIASNGEKGCPLVHCEWGRFRIYQNAAYSTHGTPIVSVDKLRVTARGAAPDALTTVRFPQPSFDAIMANPVVKARFAQLGMTYAEAKARYEREAPKEVIYRTAVATVTGSGEPVNEKPPPELGPVKMPGAGPLAAPGLNGLARGLSARGGAISDKLFLSAIAKAASAARRPPSPVLSINLPADYMMPAIAPTTPKPETAPKRKMSPAEAAEADNPHGAKPQEPLKQLQQQ